MLELELDGAVAGGDGHGVGEGHGVVRVGDVVRVGEMLKGGERKGVRREAEGKGVVGVVVRVGRGVAIAVGGGEGEKDEGGDELGWGGRLWV